MARKRYYVTEPTSVCKTKDKVTITERIYELFLTDGQAAQRILKGHKVVDADADDAIFELEWKQSEDADGD